MKLAIRNGAHGRDYPSAKPARHSVHVSFGFRTMGRGGTNQRPGVTATVHDRLCAHRTVGVFRSEFRANGRTVAIEEAHQLALELNRAAA